MKIKKCSECGIDCYLFRSNPPLCASCARKTYKPLKSKITPKMIEGVEMIDIASLKLRNQKPIAKVSDKQRRLNAAYMALRKQYIKDHPFCTFKVEHNGKEFNCGVATENIHHMKGRGKYLLDSTTWMPTCLEHHQYIEMNPKEAKELGYSQNRLDK